MASSSEYVNGDVSFWFRDQGGLPNRRPSLQSSVSSEVVIVGGGLTGLWSAYYLKKSQPSMEITILEKEFCGFGASGRNGGYVTPRLYWPRGDREHANRSQMRRLAVESVEETWRVLEEEGVEAGQRRCGALMVATNRSQAVRLSRHELESDEQFLDAEEVQERVKVSHAQSGIFESTTFRVQPAALVRGLMDVVLKLGVQIFEDTEVTKIEPRQVHLKNGHIVEAHTILRATEGFTSSLKGLKRRLLPVNSSMIVTAPLGEDVWESIGWSGREMVDEAGHAVVYSQVTDDGRIALGGRGLPYRFGSKVDDNGIAIPQTLHELRDILTRLFPSTRDVAIEHMWCGSLGVPRNWRPSVGYQRDSGLGWAGGYTGNGVAAANMAGRTFTDLVLSNESTLARSPWVNKTSRNWEIEPLRYIGGNLIYGMYGFADNLERKRGTSKTSSIAKLADLISQKP